MKKIKVIGFILVLIVSINSFALSKQNQATIVRNDVIAGFNAYNQGNAQAFAKYNLTDKVYSFESDGSKLTHGFNKHALAKQFKAGLKTNVKCENIKVHIYGDNKVAVVTGYVIGKMTSPDGKQTSVHWRMTMVWLRTKHDKWKAIHWHVSPLIKNIT